MKRFILMITLILMLCSCRSTKVVEVDVPKVEKEYVYKTDTLIKEDSIYIFQDRYIKNDTIFLTKFQDRFKYVYKTKIDTLIKVDTITIVDEAKVIEQQETIDALTQVMNYYRILGMMLIGLVCCTTIMYLFKK